MIEFIRSRLGMTKPARYAADELEMSRLHLLQHESGAEYHLAQAEMYRKRIARLERYTGQLPAKQPIFRDLPDIAPVPRTEHG